MHGQCPGAHLLALLDLGQHVPGRIKVQDLLDASSAATQALKDCPTRTPQHCSYWEGALAVLQPIQQLLCNFPLHVPVRSGPSAACGCERRLLVLA